MSPCMSELAEIDPDWAMVADAWEGLAEQVKARILSMVRAGGELERERSKPRPIRPPVKWHGGKSYLCQRIVEQLPPHHTYVEPYGGCASVLLNKSPASVEIYNDLDGRISRLFRVLRDHGAELCRLLRLTSYSEVEFMAAADPTNDEIEAVRRDFVRWRQSIGGRGESFSFTKHRSRRGMADVVSGYLSAVDANLPRIIDRFRRVQILCRPALDVIKKWDGPDTLIYCDPPYVHGTRHRGSRNVYAVEMTDDDHRQLAEVLHGCRSKVVLSGYPSKLYTELYADWRIMTFEMPNNAAGGRKKARKFETLWMNF